MKGFIALVIAISIYDIPHDPKSVIVEACIEGTAMCSSVKIERRLQEDPKALDAIAKHLKEQLKY